MGETEEDTSGGNVKPRTKKPIKKLKMKNSPKSLKNEVQAKRSFHKKSFNPFHKGWKGHGKWHKKIHNHGYKYDGEVIEKYNSKAFQSDKTFPIDDTKMQRYKRGDSTEMKFVRNGYERRRVSAREKKISFALEQSVKSEFMLTEEAGFLELDEGEEIGEVTQADIQEAVDAASACKRFDLTLSDFGPYRMNYTNNGRFLLLGGRKGHVAAMDWISKKLLCEINVMESVYDVAWLHQETMYSVAQKKWVYFYDNQGIELHCVKHLHNAVRLVFLPYHFLLSAVSSDGILSWLDVTMGQMVQELHIPVHHNPATVAQHPGNALICLGQPSGVVSFWSPNHPKPNIIKWCHKQALCSLAFDPKGHTFVTASVNRRVKIWDARNLNGPLQKYVLRSAPNWINISQKGCMAFGMGNVVEVYKDFTVEGDLEKKLYLRHNVGFPVRNMEFCPFEDVLGIGHAKGFSSMLVPGSGEANFDALESNPFQSKSQRREMEVKRLLTKIPAELITWDPHELRRIHVPSLEEIIEEKKKISFIKPPKVVIEPRYKSGKSSGSANASKRKQIIKEDLRRQHIKNIKNIKGDEKSEGNKSMTADEDVLDRFKPKGKK